MAVTHRFRVFPLYQQVEIRDAADDVDRPLWETGEERVLAAAQCIVLATRSDLYGEVEIEVRVGADLDDQAGGQPLFDGELLTTGPGIRCRSAVPVGRPAQPRQTGPAGCGGGR